jgi:DsbC/DsbD-like thiol-disulfide interchange protein
MQHQTIILFLAILQSSLMTGCMTRSESRPEVDVSASNIHIPPKKSDGMEPEIVETPESDKSMEQSTAPIELAAPTPDNPVTFTASIEPQVAKPGERIALKIYGHVLSTWHIYSADGPSGVAFPTRFRLSLPDEIQKDGEWVYPRPELEMSPHGPISKYVHEFQASVDLRLADSVSEGTIELKCSVEYQACNLSRCLPPKTLRLIVPVIVSKGTAK